MKMRNFLMQSMARITKHSRYHPEDQELDKKTHWSKNIWVINIFRAYEWLFGRGYGIRPESSISAEIRNGKVYIVYKLHSFEAVVAHIEFIIRLNIGLIFTALKSILMLNFNPNVNYRSAFVTFGILGFIFSFKTSTQFLPLFGLAIAFDAAHTGDTTGNANSLTYSHTITGSNPILFDFAHTYVSGSGATGDIITGVTYNGVTMTFVDKQLTTGIYARYQYLFILVNPATGANNIVISANTASFRLISSSASYSGAKQTGQPDASGKKTTEGVTSQELSTTTVADNCWVVSGGVAVLETIAASTGVTLRSGGNSFNTRVGDSNGVKTPAGAYSMTWTTSSSSPFNVIQASIAPAAPLNTSAMFAMFR